MLSLGLVGDRTIPMQNRISPPRSYHLAALKILHRSTVDRLSKRHKDESRSQMLL